MHFFVLSDYHAQLERSKLAENMWGNLHFPVISDAWNNLDFLDMGPSPKTWPIQGPRKQYGRQTQLLAARNGP